MEQVQVKTEPVEETSGDSYENANIKQEVAWRRSDVIVEQEVEDSDLVAIFAEVPHDVCADYYNKKGGKVESTEHSWERSLRKMKTKTNSDAGQYSDDVILDRYNSDLSLKISEGNLSATPFTEGSFATIWSGVKGTHGIKRGKVAFEVKLTENCFVSHLPADDVSPNVLRVGWSAKSASLQLGEEVKSFGYGCTGKSASKCKFADYGERFTEGDVVTAYLDMDNETDDLHISFAKNGNFLGLCFSLKKSILENEALFPHIFTKNVIFECNFGAAEPWFPLRKGFVFISNVPVEERVRATLPPATKSDCEVIMMIGLPASGKTTWAEKLKTDNPEKNTISWERISSWTE